MEERQFCEPCRWRGRIRVAIHVVAGTPMCRSCFGMGDRDDDKMDHNEAIRSIAMRKKNLAKGSEEHMEKCPKCIGKTRPLGHTGRHFGVSKFAAAANEASVKGASMADEPVSPKPLRKLLDPGVAKVVKQNLGFDPELEIVKHMERNEARIRNVSMPSLNANVDRGPNVITSVIAQLERERDIIIAALDAPKGL